MQLTEIGKFADECVAENRNTVMMTLEIPLYVIIAKSCSYDNIAFDGQIRGNGDGKRKRKRKRRDKKWDADT